MPSRFYLWDPEVVEGVERARIILILRGVITYTPAKLAWAQLVAPAFQVSWRSFEGDLHRVQTGKRSPYYNAEPAELRVIRKHTDGPHKQHLAQINLVSIRVLHRALLRRQVIPEARQLQAAFDLFFRTGVNELRQLPATQLQAQALRASNNTSTEVPLELPRLHLTQAELHIPHYTLAVVAPRLWEGTLAVEIQGLNAYLTASFILDRPAKVQLKSTNATTWTNITRSIGQFMGFAHLYRAHDNTRLTLYRDHFQSFLAFISFLIDRKLEGSNFYVACSTAKRVLAYLKHDAAVKGTPYSTSQEATYRRQLEVVGGVANQLGPVKHNAKVDQEQLEAEGGWADAAEVVFFSTGVVAAAEFALRQAGGIKTLTAGRSAARPAKFTAAKIHDALLVAFNFAYMPPLRPTVLITISHPSVEQVRPELCKAAGCTIKGCKGNRLERGSDGGYELWLPHHKNGRRWSRKVVHFRLPAQLQTLLHAWVEAGWEYMRAGAHVRTLFFNNNGEPLTLGTFGAKWKAMLRDGGIQANFPPRRLRHIFVTDRLENPDMPGPDDEHAAVVMGNSVKAWRKHYHTMHQHYGAQAAVDKMDNYRKACLAKIDPQRAQLLALREEEEKVLGREAVVEGVVAAFEELEIVPVGVPEEEEEEERAKAEEEEREERMAAMDAADAEFEEDDFLSEIDLGDSGFTSEECTSEEESGDEGAGPSNWC